MKIIHPKDDHRVVVREVLRISDDLNSEFRRQAELYGRVSRFSADAKRRVRDLKNELEIVSARIRKIVSARADSRLTKDEMQAMLIRKKSYMQKWRELNDAIYHEDMISGLLRALEHKKDALVGLGANYRHELPDELRMLSKEVRRRQKRLE
jgi:hypothetical protein